LLIKKGRIADAPLERDLYFALEKTPVIKQKERQGMAARLARMGKKGKKVPGTS